MDDNNGDILVICRFRPLNNKELNISTSLCISFPTNKSVTVPQDGQPLTFNFDQVFTPSSSQEQIYTHSAKPIVESVMQGYNGTVLAYGQTSSGKTFTMTGILEDPSLMGIIPRMVSHLFNYISNSSDLLEFTVKISYCELYMEKIRDLIDLSRKDLKIHEDKLKGIYISNLSETYVNTKNEVYDLMKLGTGNREVGYTDMNSGSSRSHALFVVTVSQTDTQTQSTKSGKLFLVDLAGSEKVGKTGATGKRLEEAKMINKSLTVLGLVINNLTDSKSTHVPYRDSKLTRILQDSLGGNSKTALVITCSPSVYNIEETISTLRFGFRAKSVKNKPKVNKELTVAELKILLAKSQEELERKCRVIESLQNDLKTNGKLSTRHSEVEGPCLSENDDLKEKLEQETFNSSELKNELCRIETMNQELSLDNSSMMTELKACHEEIIDLKCLKDRLIEEIEDIKSSKDVYEKQISDMNLQIVSLQQTVKDKNDALSQMQENCSSHISTQLHNDSLAKAAKKISDEQEKNSLLCQQIKLLQDRNEELSKNYCNLEALKENIAKEVQVQEAAKFQKEKELLNNDLQNRIKKVIELELALDDSRETLRIFESKLSHGDKVILKRNEVLEKNIEHITSLYYNLLNERSIQMHDNEVLVKKVIRLFERINSLEEQIRIKEMSRFEDMSSGEGVLNNSRSSQFSCSKIKKPIKGGKNFRT